ncbi:testis-specific serine/threonine-protein kinase 3-like [Macrosteles quadrilineatus]|uniref:testis-specific serine/threonine-protein kinase 3-like n=1 Tax=Macrosteles quadrilineatus TaxID=74068 RepID=UPI0023E297AB|nr:testis-specific serine/threonine-protein kinase 3-like [Macrosteles quadrilineatus]
MVKEGVDTGGTRANQDGTEEKTDRLSVMDSHGYSLGKIIGTGSYAIVKVAKSQRHSDEEVAIKIVTKTRAPKDYLVRFLPREIEVIKSLDHPNIVKFIQAIETPQRVFIVIEYAENGSLLDVIKKESRIEEDPRARKWFCQLRDAVNYCHDEGVVHRDIKCENLLLDKSHNLKVTDFGFARGHMKPKNGGLPVLSETFCGSYAYASPEILKGVAYDPMFSDVWSMGVVLFAMLYGKLPYDDGNYKRLVKLVQAKVKFPVEPEISIQCKALMEKLMSPIKTRPSVKQVKKDPWVRKDDKTESV